MPARARNPPIGTAIAAIDVGQRARVNKRVVERGGEHAPGGLVGVDRGATEQAIPLRGRGTRHRVEVPARQLGQIAPGARLIGRGDRDFGLQGATSPQIEREQIARRAIARFGRQTFRPDHRMVEAQRKRHFARCPIGRIDAAVGTIGAQAHLACSNPRAFGKAQSMLEIGEHPNPPAMVEAIAVKRNARGAGKRDAHCIVGQAHRIEARVRGFAGFVVMAGKVVGAPRAQRHQQDIAHFGQPGAALMRLRKTQDERRTILIAAGIVPAVIGVVGPRRDHAERARCCRRGVPGPVAADERIDIVDRRMRQRRRCRQCQRHRDPPQAHAPNSTGLSGVSITSPTTAPGHHWSRSAACIWLTGSASRMSASI